MRIVTRKPRRMKKFLRGRLNTTEWTPCRRTPARDRYGLRYLRWGRARIRAMSTSGKFPGLRELMEGMPKHGTIAGYIKNACAYKWSEVEKRWVDDPDVKPVHYVKYPGEGWKEVKLDLERNLHSTTPKDPPK